MPRGPKGEKRPADVVANAVHIMRIATGEITEGPTSTTKVSPAMASGLETRLWDIADLTKLVEAYELQK